MATAVNSDIQTVRNFRCNNCGATLDISKSFKGHAICAFCKTESVIQGLEKNAEILAKENINCGIPLTASPEMLHGIVVSIFKNADNVPLDVFDKVEVVKEEKYCIPAYSFDCNGTVNFVYEIGNARQQQSEVNIGNKTRIVSTPYIEWTHMSGASSTTDTFVSSGNKEFTSQIQKIYQTINHNLLVDAEELEFPSDAISYGYNFPQSASFNEFVRPCIEKTLEQKAISSINKNKHRNFSINGSNIQKENEVRVLLGMYHIVYRYGDADYNIWVSADGQKTMYDEPPVDMQRKQSIIKKQQEIVAVPDKTAWLKYAIIICVCAMSFTYGISLLGAIIFGVFLFKKKKHRKDKIAQLKSEVNALLVEIANVKNNFTKENKHLNGIYKAVDVLEVNIDAENTATIETMGKGFNVIMINAGKNKINVIKEVNKITRCGLSEAKKLIDNVPSNIKICKNYNEAKTIAETLLAVGATLEIR